MRISIEVLYSLQQCKCCNCVITMRYFYMNICKGIDPSMTKFNRRGQTPAYSIKQCLRLALQFTSIDKGTLRNKHIRQRHCRLIRSRAKKVGGRYLCCCRYFAVTLNNLISHFPAFFFNISSTCKYLLRKKTIKCS